MSLRNVILSEQETGCFHTIHAMHGGGTSQGEDFNPQRQFALAAVTARIQAEEDVKWSKEVLAAERKEERQAVLADVEAYRRKRPWARWSEIYLNVPNHYKGARNLQHSMAMAKAWRRRQGIAESPENRTGPAAEYKRNLFAAIQGHRIEHPKASWPEIFEDIPNHYKNPESLARTYAKRVERGLEASCAS